MQAQSVGKSPFGPDDDIGLIQSITGTERMGVLHAVTSGKVYDLSVEFFMGMPGPQSHDETMPAFTHFYPVTPEAHTRQIARYFGGNAPEGVGIGAMEDAITMTLHHGTQIDAFAHVNYNGKIFNGFDENEYFGLTGWTKGGVEKIPPIVGKGIMIDVAAAMGKEILDPGYVISVDDLKAALRRQDTALEKNNIVLIRTGVMSTWPDADVLYSSSPGLDVTSAAWLVDNGAIRVGADNASVDRTPLLKQSVHGLLLVERGVNIIEQLWLEQLSNDEVYEFALIALPLKIRGGGGSPIRVIAIPIN